MRLLGGVINNFMDTKTKEEVVEQITKILQDNNMALEISNNIIIKSTKDNENSTAL